MKQQLTLPLLDLVLLAAAYTLGYSLADAARRALGFSDPDYGLLDGPIERHAIFAMVALALTFWLSVVRRHAARRLPFWEMLRDIFVAVFFAALCDAATMYMMKLPFARLAWAMGWTSTLVLLPLGRHLATTLLIMFGKWRRPVLLVGNGANALAAWLAIESDRFMGYEVARLVVLSQVPATNSLLLLAGQRNLPVTVGIEGIDQVVLLHPHVRIVVALEPEEAASQPEIIQTLSKYDDDLIIAPPLRGLPLYGTEPLFFFSHEVLLLRTRNNLAQWLPARIKRLFDLLVSTAGLLAIAPILVWIIIRIRADGGPAIFAHQRIGQAGKVFWCYKFRTMIMNSDEILAKLLDSDLEAKAEWAKDFKLRSDPRITKIGDFLRKTSLDELPQLLNVVKGEMSLVGPRPIVDEELSRYGADARYYLEAKPGITGLWQISGRNNLDYSRRVMLDTWYVKNWSLWHDVVIILKTIPIVLRRDGAY